MSRVVNSDVSTLVAISVLGPLEVNVSGRPQTLPSPKERSLLAHLAARAQTVTTDALIETLWGEEPPRTAGKALQNHVVHLRRVLEPEHDRSSEGPRHRLLRLSAGGPRRRGGRQQVRAPRKPRPGGLPGRSADRRHTDSALRAGAMARRGLPGTWSRQRSGVARRDGSTSCACLPSKTAWPPSWSPVTPGGRTRDRGSAPRPPAARAALVVARPRPLPGRPAR